MHSPHELVTIDRSGDLDRQRVSYLPILVIHAHTSCNCRCMMCDIWKTKENRAFRPSDLEPHLASIRRLGVRWIVFSGGEPLLNPELASLCSILKAENIHLTLLTTGLLLGKCAAQVADSFDDVIVSLDGPQAVHDSIRRVESAFFLLRSGIAAVRQLRPEMSITARTTVQRQNHLHLRNTVRAAKQLSLNAISFLAADLTSQAFNRPQPWTPDRQNDVALSVEELTAKLRRIARHFRAQLGLARTESPLCNAPWVSAVVETDGTVRPCFFHRPIGNLRDKSLYDIINGDQALAFRSALDIRTNATCNQCVCSLNHKS
jgi:MoaA/NifB/PqqE/SkfB family radical SAM enzyme